MSFIGNIIKGVFGRREPVYVPPPPPPPPPPAIEDAQARQRELEDQRRKRKGFAATLVTGEKGTDTPYTAAKTLTGE